MRARLVDFCSFLAVKYPTKLLWLLLFLFFAFFLFFEKFGQIEVMYYMMTDVIGFGRVNS